MKFFLFIVFLLIFPCTCIAQGWTIVQLDKANTASKIAFLSIAEKETIQYINLCRLYPKDFARIEVIHYSQYEGGSNEEEKNYKNSLIKELMNRKPVKCIVPDKILFEDAACYVREISDTDITPHKRIHCAEVRCAECISFGYKNGREIVLQLLVDQGVESLGHRKICLDADLLKVGIKIFRHFMYEYAAVLDFC